MEKKNQKQMQWGLTIPAGLFIIVGTVGHLENGGDILPNVFKGLIGLIVSLWGVVKANQWGLFEEGEEC